MKALISHLELYRTKANQSTWNGPENDDGHKISGSVGLEIATITLMSSRFSARYREFASGGK